MKIPSLDSLKKLFKGAALFDKLKKAHGSGFDFKLAAKKFGWQLRPNGENKFVAQRRF